MPRWQTQLVGTGTPVVEQIDTSKPFEAKPFVIGDRYMFAGRRYELTEDGWRDIGEWPDRSEQRKLNPRGEAPPDYQPPPPAPPAAPPKVGDVRMGSHGPLVWLDEEQAGLRSLAGPGWYDRKPVYRHEMPDWFTPDPLLHELR